MVHYHVFLFLVFQFFILKSSSLYSIINCSDNKTFTANSAYQVNLDTLLASLSTASATFDFYNTTNTGGSIDDSNDTVYGLFNCRGDVPPQTCRECVAEGTMKLASGCQWKKQGMIWLDWCYIRYSDQRFFSLVELYPRLEFKNPVNITNSKIFFPTVEETLKRVAEEAANGGPSGYKKFAMKRAGLSDIIESESLFVHAQCTRDLSSEGCRTCLRYAIGNVTWCCLGRIGGRVAYPSCGIRFELYPYTWDYIASPKSPPRQENNNNRRGRSRTINILIVVLVIVSAILLSFCCYLRRRKARKTNYKTALRKNFGEESITLEGLQFDLTIVKAATNNFSRENKIGKGGFGEVYKGILSNGRHIAVKRLSTSSKQGSVEFENEILLIAKLQHRNLVTLIGFCVEDHEQILIYDYMPNGSLDHLLFGTQQQKLSWTERYKIIRGTALGILYLHEHSRLKVIHRDLKPSNVLLDENMNPKISDFGMARIVEINEDIGNTNRIAGTYGYMSPEYAMLGQFSEKSDIFSFGVMVLEIVTGKRNVRFYESHSVVEGLIGYVWRQWKDQEPLSILDSRIKENYAEMEVMKCIHIGLLCVQENPSVRPTMTTIISYLNNHSLELPSPHQPAFLMDSRRMDQEFGTHQESSSNQADNGFKMFSVNGMSTSDLYPR